MNYLTECCSYTFMRQDMLSTVGEWAIITIGRVVHWLNLRTKISRGNR